MGYIFIFAKNKAKTKLTAASHQTQGLWKALIQICNGLVAKANKACPAKSRIIPNAGCKSKKAKGKRANLVAPGSRLCPLPLLWLNQMR
jgi:ABC-type Fe3+-citrate transport system substrate-binding protein